MVNSLFQSKICYGLISSSSFNFRTKGEFHLSISFVFTFTSRSMVIIAALKSLIISYVAVGVCSLSSPLCEMFRFFYISLDLYLGYFEYYVVRL